MITTLLNLWPIFFGILFILIASLLGFRWFKSRHQPQSFSPDTTPPPSPTTTPDNQTKESLTPSIEDQLAPIEEAQRKAEAALEHWVKLHSKLNFDITAKDKNL